MQRLRRDGLADGANGGRQRGEDSGQGLGDIIVVLERHGDGLDFHFANALRLGTVFQLARNVEA